MSPADLASARVALGMSRPALAARLGVPTSTVWRWERGAHRIEHPAILALALEALALRRVTNSPP